ncbi:hypothetical protein V9K67_01645 [Paraflavisolibacter sp. H34]|uniref:hypothetical protein n=1 Tax=Huijunlia imazamoxiresistens TaxID=3127457 RepID=UPI003019EF6C
MVNQHLSEEELQAYAADPAHCSNDTREHVLACADCRARAAAYELLFAGLEQQPAPAFDFDLEAAVLAQLTPPESKPFPGILQVVLLLLAALVFTALLVWVNYRNFSWLVEGLSPFLQLMLLCTGLVLLSGLAIDAWRSYQKKADLLDIL